MFFDFSQEALCRAGLLYCYSFLSTRQISALFRAFKSAKNVWHASSAELLRGGLSENAAVRLIENRQQFTPEIIAAELNKHKIGIVCVEDTAYPPLLKQIYDAPPALFFRGALTQNTFSRALAVVGTRKITPYGHQIINQVVPTLVRAGITIASGLALGSDGLAHTTALSAGGITVAFLGSGLDDAHLYPSSHATLAQKIIKNNGAIISEFPPGTLPLRRHFPIRNRLIAGSTLGVLVTEAAEDSGSLITARLGIEYGRDVFAIPGTIHAPLSVGPNKLIQMGAHLVLNADDILSLLDISTLQELPFDANAQKIAALSNDEQKIITALNAQPRHIDEIITLSALENKTVAMLLTMLELNGLIKHIGNRVYAAI